MKQGKAYSSGFSPWASAAALVTAASFLALLQASGGHELGGILGSDQVRLACFHSPERDASQSAIVQEEDEALSFDRNTHQSREGWSADRADGWKPMIQDQRIRARVPEATALSAPVRSMVLRL